MIEAEKYTGMAEAHQAVSYSKIVTHDNHHQTYHHGNPHIKFDCRTITWNKWLSQLTRKLRNVVYPANVESFGIILMTVTVLHFAMVVPFDVVNVMMALLPRPFTGASLLWHLIVSFISGLLCWILFCVIMKAILKTLLTYRGFMSESRGKGVTLKTKIWGIVLGTIIRLNKPTLYSFQASLPSLPLPSLDDTVQRYLRSMRPLTDDNDYQRITKEANEFRTGIGKKLQRYLFLKRLWATNYVSDWWEQYVYLRGRAPLMVNSNFHCFDIFQIPSNDQTSRAASVVYEMLKFRKKLENETVPPVMVQGLVPLCSTQYKRMFNTARVPGIECDKIVHYENEDVNHMVVLCNGCYYNVIIQQGERLLNPAELKYQFDCILNMKHDVPSHGEKYLGSLTAWDRTNWAIAREKYFSSGVNETSLKVVESAAIFLVLNDKPYEWESDLKSEKVTYYTSQSMTGNIYDRWFDKSFQLIVGTNGRYAFNAEHTWADAPCLGHMVEELHLDELENFDAQGNLKGKIRTVPPTPTRIQWNFNDDLLNVIDNAYSDGLKLASDIDYKLLFHSAFGKGFIKSCKVSPDAFIQMALQLAYYRDYGKFSLTYEASMTRLYRDGRTETVRSCTIESSAWVRAMEDENSNTYERVKLLQAACKQHQIGYLDAMCGRGIDRHLFCLFVISKYLKIDSKFLQDAISEPWRLSTSQTPHGQTPKIDLKKQPFLVGCGGGFGPVAMDGITSSDATNSDRFADRISKAMNDIKLLFQDYDALVAKDEGNKRKNEKT